MRLATIVLLVTLNLVSADLEIAWQAWKVKYNKQYENTIEDNVRKNIWQEAFRQVSRHNLEFSLGLHTYEQEVGKFADETQEERLAYMGGFTNYDHDTEPTESVELLPETPSSIDWRNHYGENYVTSVKDQGNCNSGYAFSATGSLESQCAIKYGSQSLVSLSAQQCVSCDMNDLQCRAGNYPNCWKWEQYSGSAQGFILWSDYPYTSENGVVGACLELDYNIYAAYAGKKSSTPLSEAALENTVGNYGPTSVTVDASQSSFANYKSGIYYEPNCRDYGGNHDMVVVGYNQNSQGKYWIVKNSYGKHWGQSGYIWMAKDRDNNCGIASNYAYPICGDVYPDN